MGGQSVLRRSGSKMMVTGLPAAPLEGTVNMVEIVPHR